MYHAFGDCSQPFWPPGRAFRSAKFATEFARACGRAMAAMRTECCHRDYITLLDFGEAQPQLLVHKATGESAQLPQRSILMFDSDDHDGFAFVAPPGDDGDNGTWVNDLLDRSFHNMNGNSGEREDIVSKVDGTRTCRAELARRMTPRPMIIQHQLGNLCMEFYDHDLPKRFVWVRKFWVLSRVQDFIFGASSGSKWICKNYLRMVESVRSPLPHDSGRGVICGGLCCITHLCPHPGAAGYNPSSLEPCWSSFWLCARA